MIRDYWRLVNRKKIYGIFKIFHSKFIMNHLPSLTYITFILLTLSMTSCFKEDDPITPYVPPEGLIYIKLENSIYENQVFFDFSSESIKKISSNSTWQLGFESSGDGFHIIVNSSDFWGVVNTESTDFQKTDFDLTGEFWWFDSSTGDLDSTAIGNWVDTTTETFSYTFHTYILGQYDGLKYHPYKKLKFMEVTDSTYSFVSANIDNTETDTVIIHKNDTYNYVHYSLKTSEQISIEPPKETWDVVFSQYQTILYTDDGVPTPYFVRGTLLNPYKTTAVLDTTMYFFDIAKEDVYQFHFTRQKDIIGHDWKSVEVDEESNSAEYAVRENYNYFIVDSEDNYFKMQFLSYTNTDGEKGFPSFQYYHLD